MKKYKILKDFIGSQTGYSLAVLFKKGEVAEINWHLAEGALKDGSIAEINETEYKREKKIKQPKEKK